MLLGETQSSIAFCNVSVALTVNVVQEEDDDGVDDDRVSESVGKITNTHTVSTSVQCKDVPTMLVCKQEKCIYIDTREYTVKIISYLIRHCADTRNIQLLMILRGCVPAKLRLSVYLPTHSVGSRLICGLARTCNRFCLFLYIASIDYVMLQQKLAPPPRL